MDYAHIAYPSSLYPNATLKTSGCGVCCASMVVENLTKESFPPEICAKFSIDNGARAKTGTDMVQLAKSISKRFNLSYTIETNIDVVLDEIKQGAIVVANTKGGVNGLFSDSGHYVTLYDYIAFNFIVLDPYLYPSKFNTKTRKGKVEQQGDILKVSKENVALDCKKYYIFKNAIN